MRTSYDTLVDVFECIENFTRRLKIYKEIEPTPVMTEMIIKILVEMLAVLALATKQINQGKLSKSSNTLPYDNSWLKPPQRNLQESFWVNTTLNRSFSDWID